MAIVSYAVNLSGGNYLDKGAPNLGATLPALTDLDTALDEVDAAAVEVAALDLTALAAAMAVLVADGASPTQAHVTTANNALTAFTSLLTPAKTDTATATTAIDTAVSNYETALTAATGDADGDATLSYDDSVFTTKQSVWSMFRAFAKPLQVPGIGAP